MKRLKIISLSMLLLLVSGFAAAQDATEMIALDEDVNAADLEISEPGLLPDSPFYFLKNMGREVQSFFTFDPVKKAELREKFASEKLMELKKLVEGKKKAEVVQRATENYQKEVAEVKAMTERIKEKAQENVRVNEFLDKYVAQNILHQRVLSKLETQVPQESFEKIKEAREKHLEIFGEVMVGLEDRKEQITERLQVKMEEVKGSEFKIMKNLEILKGLEEKMPQAAKEAIQMVQENSLIKLKTKVEQMSPQTLEKFKIYTENIVGEKGMQVEILENLRLELKENLDIGEKIMEVRERVMEKVRERAEKINCPEMEKPAAGLCEEGRTVVKKDNNGCVISFDCVIAAEVEIVPGLEKPAACIALWDPACGNDGKTYSNSCYAKLTGAEVAYQGECREAECKTDADCPQLKCGPANTISAKCLGVKAQCVAGKCLTVSVMNP